MVIQVGRTGGVGFWLTALAVAPMMLGCSAEPTKADKVIPPYPDYTVDAVWERVTESAASWTVDAAAFDDQRNVVVATSVFPISAATSCCGLAKLDPQGTVLWQNDALDAGPATQVIAIGEDTLWLSAVLARFDKNGDLLWQRSFGTIYQQTMDLTPDGDIVLSGRIIGPQSQSLMWLIKVDGNGETVWEQTEVPGPNRELLDTAVDKKGRIFVAHGLINDTSVALRRYDAAGALQIEVAHDCGNLIAVDPAGDIVTLLNKATGTTLCHYNAELEEQWRVTLEEFGAKTMYLSAPAFDADGNIVFSGTSFLSGQQRDSWVREFTSLGELRWHHRYDAAEGWQPFTTVVATDGLDHVVAGGSLTEAGAANGNALLYLLRD